MIALISVVGAVGIFLACLAAGRYASWFGVVIPVAITVALGEGWEWDPDATAFVIASALFGGLGLAAGLSRRRKRRAVNR